MKKMLVAAALGLASLLATGPVLAQDEASAAGEVRRIQADKGKITIKHGPIVDLKLPAMTLIYNINPGLLKDIKPGDEVKFKALHQNDQYIITEIRKD
ncbi:RND transporter [Advenella faeciporci]|uniref:RND transporter n=1 Tax=Advenella faeciporci TaxID=797535 RepID=A0A918JQ43_9BURK|nr:copper-binding protein [Advenella faeciporci]GGW95498.1 RND transporter [Advenella faeciporci]